MLSYRHAFHAGGFADVFKHAVLAFVLEYALRKAKPLYVLDTHAGAGRYDLTAPEALRTGEFRHGIERVITADPVPELVATYLALIRAANADGGLQSYPGSPALAHALLRPQDRLELAELHPTDHATLAGLARTRPRTCLARADGLRLLHARMPPPERRGVVLIDPSFEVKDEPTAVVSALARAHRRFPSGVYLLWYPVLERARTEALMAAVRATAIGRVYRIELCLTPDKEGRGMTGCGMLVVNPPWLLPAAAANGLPWLADCLKATGPCETGWLTPE